MVYLCVLFVFIYESIKTSNNVLMTLKIKIWYNIYVKLLKMCLVVMKEEGRSS